MTNKQKQSKKTYWLLVLATWVALIVLLAAGIPFPGVVVIIALAYGVAFAVTFAKSRNARLE